MSKKKDNINLVAFFNILGPIILNGINFFTIPIFTRVLGTENYGLYTIYYTWVNLMTILISLQVSGTIPVANVRMEEEDRKKYYSSILFLICISFALWMSIIFLTRPFIQKIMGLSFHMIVLVMVHAVAMAFVNFATIRYTNEKKTYFTFAISVIVAVAGIVLSLVFLKFGNWSDITKYYGRSYGAAFPYIIMGLFFLVLYLKQGRTYVSKTNWKFCLALSLPMVFHGVSQLILAQADKVMLQGMMNDSMVGIYSFTYSFAHVTNIIYSALNNTWVPFYFEDLKENKIDVIEGKTKNYIFIFTALSIGFMLLSPDVIKLFAGEDFWSGISLVPFFALANYMIFLYSFPVNYEFYHGKSIHIALGTAGAAIINCTLNYLFIPRMGMAGAAFATFISYIVLWIFHHLVSKYLIKADYHYRIQVFVPGIVVMVISAIAIGFIENYIIIRWVLACIVGVITLRHLFKTKSIF